MSGETALFFHRLHIPVLLICAVLALSAALAVPQPQPLLLAAAILGGFAMAYARLQHFSLALAASLAPLPGILWFGPAAYPLCIAFAILMAADYGRALLKGENLYAALSRALLPLLGTLLFALCWSLLVPVPLASLLASATATALCLPPLALGVSYGEDAIVRGNRSREKMQRLFTFAGGIAEPRWSLSLTGIGVVLAMLGSFQISWQPPLLDWLGAPVAGLLLFAFTRDWHVALGGALAAALVLLFSGGAGALPLFLLFALSLSRAISAYRQRGEDILMSTRRAMEDQASTILFAGLAAIIAVAATGGVLAGVQAAVGGIAALVLFPAFAGSLRWLFPARRSMEEMYRAKV